jgi:AcrR family transcriptional regulator
MARTRLAVLDGAGKALATRGVRATTMNDVAALGGIAKATLYNHMRTKDDVWRALAVAEVERLVADCHALGSTLDQALALAADRIAEHAGLRRIVTDEPGYLAALVVPTPELPVWATAREGVAQLLVAAGRPANDTSIDLVLRWLLSHVGDPGTAAGRRAGAVILAAAVPPAAAAGATAAAR